MPSNECYDPHTYDIFSNIVCERLELVEEHYNECIARIIANMIDYDFNERMDLKEFAIYVNRELMAYQQDLTKFGEPHEYSDKCCVKSHKESVVKEVGQEGGSEVEPQEKLVQSSTPHKRSYGKANCVYIRKNNEGREEDEVCSANSGTLNGAKNSVYLECVPRYEASNRGSR
jgi:hypothetical protein